MGTNRTRVLKRIITSTMKETSKGPRSVLNWPELCLNFRHCQEKITTFERVSTRAVGVLFWRNWKEAELPSFRARNFPPSCDARQRPRLRIRCHCTLHTDSRCFAKLIAIYGCYNERKFNKNIFKRIFYAKIAYIQLYDTLTE